MTTLQITLLIGLIASFLMFIGDMVLYYSKDDYDSKHKTESILSIMSKEKKGRLYIGGILGPLTSFLYAVSFYHIVLVMNSDLQWLGILLFLLGACGITFGGAYHMETAVLGLLSRNHHEDDTSLLWKYMTIQSYIFPTLFVLSFLPFGILTAFSQTLLPWWIIFFNPVLWMAFLPLLRRLPKGKVHMILCGGWSNIPFIIYYLVTLLVITFAL